ncbi:hypothetical protein Tco_0272808 [Tanacetum coccineum]
MFIKSQIYLDDEYVVITRKYFLEYTQLEIREFRDTLIQHMGYVKNLIDKRALHKREHDNRVNESRKHDTSNRLGNDAHADDADIKPIYDEELMVEIFDIVEWIDWWTRGLEEIDCYAIIIRIPLEGEMILVVQGDRSGKDLKLVSVIKMRKYLEKEYIMFLAHMGDKGANVQSILNILIERNHTEVFSEDFSKPPLTRIVKLRIDLVPGAALVTKAPY